MSKETTVTEGVLKSLEGLKSLIDATDKEGNTELNIKIQEAIDIAAHTIIDDETDHESEFEIEVGKKVAAKTISWANRGWYTSFVGPDGVHYMWI